LTLLPWPVLQSAPDRLPEGNLEWVLRSDAMLEPNEPVGLGGHLYNQ
jgi:hypothetical protein